MLHSFAMIHDYFKGQWIFRLTWRTPPCNADLQNLEKISVKLMEIYAGFVSMFEKSIDGISGITKRRSFTHALRKSWPKSLEKKGNASYRGIGKRIFQIVILY